ncbi:MAG: DNA phosphorothioation system restriction enzyme [Cyanobacteria bacterium SBLK]|nr:DNA phosphorothioation system restriction enzyme [Cyanobacteria bacterium SBLK]
MKDKRDAIGAIAWEQLAAEYAAIVRSRRVAEGGRRYSSFPQGIPESPPSLCLRDYQYQAVENWLRHQGRGILKMATGSGKTIVALAIATELYRKIGLQVLLVVCPFRHLVAQWGRECERFNLQPLLAFESVRQWQNELSTQLYNLRGGDRVFVTIVATNSTFTSEGFQSQLKFFPPKTLIVGDEAHHLGTERMQECLPRNIGLRLALSATPERYFDEDGTDRLADYFGKVLQPEFTLKDAIALGALVRYFYYPLLVELTPSEAAIYAKLTQQIGWALSKNENLQTNETLTSLLVKRSRLIGSAANKLEALRELMKTRLETTHTLFYCGDGTVGDAENPIRQLEAVTRILGTELGYRVNIYTTDTPLAEREQLREQFERGELQGLVSIRCLDEGVDIPAIENAVILASTSNPRQFIQRRGRILRPHPHKTRATLFDTIVIPPDCDRDVWEVERNLVRKELLRFLEFADLAENSQEAKATLSIIQKKYQLSRND